MNKFMSKDSEIKKGFTIIEVVLVLAVAGLIFLMVFIALPALQRSQRDAQRKQDMFRLVAALQKYKANNKQKNLWDGAVREKYDKYGSWVSNSKLDQFADQYLKAGNDTFNDPSSGKEYYLQAVEWYSKNIPTPQPPSSGSYATVTSEWADWVVIIHGNAKCENGKPQYYSNGSLAIEYHLENGGWVCHEF